ncbi:MauE/DoxX family redox-associated membrane protein [Stackebrandtia soli]|uniref:MauE/DoxX family redox-associated membrane protein n=1 Tax=Stackebrandtia soli TaxID=1892856 RepID=UPI0039E9599F
MLEWIAALQPVLLGAVLLWSACAKLFTRRGKIKANSLALAKLVGEARAPLAYRTVGAGEALLGALLLAPPVWMLEAVAAVSVSLGFIGYLAYARIAVPGASCGCMGAANTPITWRAFARAGWMLVASALAFTATAPWWTPFTTEPVGAIVVALAQAAVFVTLSPEFDGAWLVPLRRLKVRFTKPLGGGDDETIPLDATVETLQRSELYPHVFGLMRSDVREYWDEGDVRIICYHARVDDRDCTAVWAVPLHGDNPETIRVAFVDDETNETVLRFDGPPDSDEPRPDWALPATTNA